jgi:hypothetical protein
MQMTRCVPVDHFLQMQVIASSSSDISCLVGRAGGGMKC